MLNEEKLKFELNISIVLSKYRFFELTRLNWAEIWYTSRCYHPIKYSKTPIQYNPIKY